MPVVYAGDRGRCHLYLHTERDHSPNFHTEDIAIGSLSDRTLSSDPNPENRSFEQCLVPGIMYVHMPYILAPMLVLPPAVTIHGSTSCLLWHKIRKSRRLLAAFDGVVV